MADIDRFINKASLYGAAWPGKEILLPATFLASVCSMLSLVRSRRRRLLAPKGVRPVTDAVSHVASVQPTVYKFPALQVEAMETAQRMNTWAMFLYSMASEATDGDGEKSVKLYREWWAQIGDALIFSCLESIPEHQREQIPEVLSSTIRQLEIAAAQPVYVTGGSQGLGPNVPPELGGAPAGGPRGGNGGGGGSTTDRMIRGAKAGATVGAAGGPAGMAWGAVIGAGAEALGMDTSKASEWGAEQMGKVWDAGVRAINGGSGGTSDNSYIAPDQRPTQTGLIGGVAVDGIGNPPRER